MQLTKEILIEYIHLLIANNVIGDKQLLNRYKGFRAEFEYVEYLKLSYKDSYQILQGGNIISKDSNDSCLDNSYYITTIKQTEQIEDYLSVYKALSHLNFNQMYLVKFDITDLKLKTIMTIKGNKFDFMFPKLEIYQYNNGTFNLVSDDIFYLSNNFDSINRKSNFSDELDSLKLNLEQMLNGQSIEALFDLYMDRIIIDGIIGFGKQKGKIGDIDYILKSKDNRVIFIEVKEKDLPKIAKKGFGLDIPRINDFQKIISATGYKYALVVKHIDNQTNRNLVEWLKIDIKDFITNTKQTQQIEGGTGMRSVYSSNPTLICDYDLFKRF